MQQLAGAVADAAADLQGGALTSGAAAAQVGDDRGHEDQRHQQQRHVRAKVYRLDDGIGALALQPAQLVQPGDDETAHRQQVQHPRMSQPHLRGVVDAQVEQRAHHAADAAYQTADHDPLQQRRRVETHVVYVLPHPFHSIYPPFHSYLQIRIVPCSRAPVKPPNPDKRSLCETENFLVFLT